MVIDTGRFIDIIWQRKILVLLMIVIFVAVASLYSYFAPKVYRINTILQPSSFESSASLISIINHNYFNDRIAEKLNVEVSSLPKMIANNALGTDLVVVSVISKNVDQAQRVLSAFDEAVISDGVELFEAHQRTTSLFQKKVKNSLLELESILKQYSSDYSVSSKDVAGNLSRAMLVDGFLSYLVKDYENDMEFLNVKERKIIIAPQVLRPPHWPRPLFIVSFAAMVGFLFGIFVALWREKRITPV